jgi:hypothetical protein
MSDTPQADKERIVLKPEIVFGQAFVHKKVEVKDALKTHRIRSV